MTREELRDYVDEQRTLGNIPYHVYSALIDGIDTLEQESIIDKIRADIKELDIFYDSDHFSSNKDAMFKCNDILQILDKCEGESGVK